MSAIHPNETIMIIVANLLIGGQQRMALLLSQVLKSDYKVIFLVLDEQRDKDTYERPEGVEFIDLDSPPGSNGVSKLVNVYTRSRRIKSIKKVNNVATSVSFGESANIVNCLSRCKDKIITSIRGSYILTMGPRFADKLTIEYADDVVFISEGQRAEYAKYFGRSREKMHVIYNARDFGETQRLCDEPIDIDMGEESLVSVGRLVPGKCHVNLINAVALVKEKHPDVKLYIIGDGTERIKLEQHIDELGLKDNVFLLGMKTNPFAYISKASIFVYPSASEAFSNAVMEALFCRTPIITTDCKFGPREIISGKTDYGLTGRYVIEEWGILTPAFEEGNQNQSGNEKIFADAVMFLLENRQLMEKYRKLSKERCGVFFVDTYRNRWFDIIRE